MKEKYQIKMFLQISKYGTIGDNGETLDGHVCDEEYLTCIKIWKECNMKKWVIITFII